VLFLFADDILKLTAGCLERIAYCQINVLMGSVCRGLAAYRNVGSIGNREMNPDVKNISLVVAVLWPGDNDPCADDSRCVQGRTQAASGCRPETGRALRNARFAASAAGITVLPVRPGRGKFQDSTRAIRARQRLG
jgi:hypothetical protein